MIEPVGVVAMSRRCSGTCGYLGFQSLDDLRTLIIGVKQVKIFMSDVESAFFDACFGSPTIECTCNGCT